MLVALAGCETTHARLTSAADRLERSAAALDRQTRNEPDPTRSSSGYLPGLPGAREFAQQAHDFRQTVDGAGSQDVIYAYKNLWRSYHGLRDEVGGLHSRTIRADLEPVTEAFVDVERIVKNGYAPADGTLYSSGAYSFDPEYN
jgi:hypothetical protein